MKKSIIFIFIATFGMLSSYAQVGIGTNTPNAAAVLELSSTNQGMLFPRMATTPANPATGLTIFNTTDNCLQTNIGTPLVPIWKCLGPAPAAPTIDPLVCGNETYLNYKVKRNVVIADSDNFLVNIPYTGGNNVAYAAGTPIGSTNVIGLSATLQAGTLSNGAGGNIVFKITGNADRAAIAYFTISFGGQSCTIEINTCGAHTAAAKVIGDWKNFLCHNLGANTALTPDPHNLAQPNNWALNGAYIQWGKRGPDITDNSRVDWITAAHNGASGFAAAPTATYHNGDPVSSWSSANAADNSWRLSGAKTAADPCPNGWRVPTSAEWSNVKTNNTKNFTGFPTPSGNVNVSCRTCFSGGLQLGPAGAPWLTLPATGYRIYYSGYASDGESYYRGDTGSYWSSTEGGLVAGVPGARLMAFDYSAMYPNENDYRTYGFSVRCIIE